MNLMKGFFAELSRDSEYFFQRIDNLLVTRLHFLLNALYCTSLSSSCQMSDNFGRIDEILSKIYECLKLFLVTAYWRVRLPQQATFLGGEMGSSTPT